MRLRFLVLVPLAAAAVLRGQEPLNRPVPLLAAPTGPSPGDTMLSLEAARRAQELGFPALAAQLYRDLLVAPGGARAELTLALATALLDDGHPDQAEQVLRGLPGPRGAAWHLRTGLAEAVQRKFDLARAELAVIRAEELAPADRPWVFFLQGLVAGAAGDTQGAADAFRKAEQQAVTALERAHFFLAHEEEELRRGALSAQDADQIRRNAERFQGTPVGYEAARAYAVALDDLGRKGDAIAELRRQLLTLPAPEHARADDFRLLMGMIAGAGEGVGRNALMELLASGQDVDRQRVALQLLARASEKGPARASFRAELDALIAAPNPHPILGDLLLFRATWALADQPPDYQRAEDDALELLAKFPGSNLTAYAWGVLTASAWDTHRYRSAADDAARQQAETPPGEARAQLGVLRAEASFRAGMLTGDPSDFRSAADAYAAALGDRPAGVPPGELMFQRVESEIEGGSPENLENAQRALDRLAADPAFGVAYRWRAEANLARMLKIKGRTDAAYQRVSRLLQATGPAAALPAELRMRMAWLQAELSFDAREYGRTLELVGALRRSLGALAPDLRSNIASSGALLEARADFALGREADGLAVLARLREDFPAADAAVESYMIEAEHYAQQEEISTAERLYIQLAERFPSSSYAPQAYFQAALLEERLGQTKDLTQATQLLEKLVTTDPRNDLVFYARLKEGDLLRELNEFPQAQQTYELLQLHFSRHKDIDYALLALAECHAAQAGDSAHAESARALFEDLIDRVDAPVDVRVEAGFGLGMLQKDRGDAAEAQKVWWQYVVTAFLLHPPSPATQLGALGRFWMARTLVELGTLYEGEGKLGEARQVWQLALESRLSDGMDKLAQENLARLDVSAPRP